MHMGAGSYRVPWIWNYRQSQATEPGYQDSNWDHLQGSQELLSTRPPLQLHEQLFVLTVDDYVIKTAQNTIC